MTLAREAIEHLLATSGTVTEAAARAGYERKYFFSLMRRHGLTHPLPTKVRNAAAVRRRSNRG